MGGLLCSLNIFKKRPGKYYRPSYVSGQRVKESGYCHYDGDPDSRKIPAWPDPSENFVYLLKGDIVPSLASYCGRSARYKLIIAFEVPRKSKMPAGPGDYLTTSSSQ